MTRKKYAALILVMAVLLGMTLSGCGIIEFQVDKWEMRQKASKLALVKALDEYFRELYGLPPALEYDINVHFERKEFFASHPSELGYEYNFLDFDYHGQPLEEVLPLLDGIHFDYWYVDDGVNLDGIEFRAEDWGGDLERLERVWISCFRCYGVEALEQPKVEDLGGPTVPAGAALRLCRSLFDSDDFA